MPFMRLLLLVSMSFLMPLKIQADTEAKPVIMPTPWSVADGATINFDVLRGGSPFGSHKLNFSSDGAGDVTVTTDVDLKVKIGPITAYRYELDSIEQWSDGRLVALNSRTNSNGKKKRVDVRRVGSGLDVDATGFEGIVDAAMIPSSHWNLLQMYGDQMLSTETGEVLDINVEQLGREIVVVGGAALEATRYRLSSELAVDLWYDDQSRWVKMLFEARGQSIEYILNELY